MQSLALLFASLCLTSPPSSVAGSQDAQSAAVAPYVDDQTFAIVRIDATRVAAPKLAELLKSISSGYDERGEKAAALLSQMSAFVKAGGKEFYLVAGMADMGPFLIVPLAGGADAQRILEVLGSVPALENRVRQQFGSALFLGDKQTFERLKTAKPVARKELAAAFEALGDVAIQFVLLPSADSRRTIEELLPTLPAEVGGGSVKVLTRGILWAAVGLDSAPSTSLRLVVQSEDGVKAIELAYFFKTNLSRLTKLPGAEKIVPGLDALLNVLTPSIAGDRLTLALDEKNVATLLKPAARAVHQSASRSASASNLKQIGLALHHYLDVHKAFPTVANLDAQGKPLLSWRVHILPWVGENQLYKEFHLNEPWDSEHNKKLIARMPKVFEVPGLPGNEKGMTTYLAPVAANAMWTGTAATVRIGDVTDGTANTIFVVDAVDKLATPWTKPADYSYDPKDPAAGVAFRFGNSATILFTDGSVHQLPRTIDAKMFLALFTRNGGEIVSY